MLSRVCSIAAFICIISVVEPLPIRHACCSFGMISYLQKSSVVLVDTMFVNSLYVLSNTVMGRIVSNVPCDVGDLAKSVIMPTLKESW